MRYIIHLLHILHSCLFGHLFSHCFCVIFLCQFSSSCSS
nr:MAG TPA: hypothetical protein [Caudoviricetes sp.]